MNTLKIRQLEINDIVSGCRTTVKGNRLLNIKAIFAHQDIEFQDSNGSATVIESLVDRRGEGYIGVIDVYGVIWCIDLPKVSQWHLYGQYYGYPDCCIDHYHRYPHPLTYTPAFGTGYVPCPRCAARYGTKLIDEINHRRSCTIPFPTAELPGSEEILLYYQHDYVIPAKPVDIYVGTRGALA